MNNTSVIVSLAGNQPCSTLQLLNPEEHQKNLLELTKQVIFDNLFLMNSTPLQQILVVLHMLT